MQARNAYARGYFWGKRGKDRRPPGAVDRQFFGEWNNGYDRGYSEYLEKGGADQSSANKLTRFR